MIILRAHRTVDHRLLAATLVTLGSASSLGAQSPNKSAASEGRIADARFTAKQMANANGVPIALAGHSVQLRIGGTGTCDITVMGTWRKAVVDGRKTLPATVEIAPEPGLNTVGVYGVGCHGAASAAILVGGTLESVKAGPMSMRRDAAYTWKRGEPVHLVVAGAGWCGDYVVSESQGLRFQEIHKTWTPAGGGPPHRDFTDTIAVTPRLAGVDSITVFPGPMCAGTPQVVIGQVRGDDRVGAIERLTPLHATAHPGVPVQFTIVGTKGASCDSATLSFGDGQSLPLSHFSFDLSVQHMYAAPGHYMVTARPQTARGVACSGGATTDVDVSWPRLTKVAAPGETVIGRQVAVTLEGEPATCGDLTVNFGDGSVGHAPALPGRVEHVYKAAGTRTITATVTTRCSGTASTTIVIDAPEKESKLAPHKGQP